MTSLTLQVGALPLGTPVRYGHGGVLGAVVGYRLEVERGESTPRLWYRVDFGNGDLPWVHASQVAEAAEEARSHNFPVRL